MTDNLAGSEGLQGSAGASAPALSLFEQILADPHTWQVLKEVREANVEIERRRRESELFRSMGRKISNLLQRVRRLAA